MSKKAHKKLRDLQRLQSMYGNPALPTYETVQTEKAKANSVASLESQFATSHVVNANHTQVAKDLKSLFMIIIVMTGLLLAVNWVVQNTNFAGSLIEIGKNISN